MRKRSDTKVAAYYETHSVVPDIRAAKKNGTLIVSKPGENLLEALMRRRAAEKKTTVSMRVPVRVVTKAKEQAAVAGMPWTSYVRAVLEHALAQPQTKKLRAAAAFR